jgi:attachment p12 family protein
MDWQQIAALAIVALAALWLVRTQILAPRRGGCGGCGGCGSAPGPNTLTQAGNPPLVQIELDSPKAGRKSGLK